MKIVQIVGHAFDSLPGHITIPARGTGSNAHGMCHAVRVLFSDKRLHRKRIHNFKLSVVIVIEEEQEK
jgi:hypothetical protein